MKTNLKWQLTISALCLILSGCGNNPDISTNTYNTMSGTITDYTNGTVDSLKCFSNNNDLIGTCAVSKDGKFSITLSTPTGNKIGKINNVIVSDTNAIVSSPARTIGYKNGLQKELLYKCNITNSSNLGISSVLIVLCYSDRDLIIKGINNVSSTKSIIWDVTLKKGWNEMTMELPSTQSISYSTTFPTGLNWILFPN